MQKNAKESKRTQENARSFIKNARERPFIYKERKKNARECALFYKERKRTQENTRSFEKNACPTLHHGPPTPFRHQKTALYKKYLKGSMSRDF